MPILHPTTGRAVYGFGPVSVDGAPVAGGNGGSWYTDGAILFQECDTSCRIVQLTLATGQRTIMDELGAYTLSANAGVGAATFEQWRGGPSYVRTWTPGVGPFLGPSLFEVTESGQVAMFKSPATGTGILVVGANGQIQLDLPVQLVSAAVKVRDNLCAYYTGVWNLVNVLTGEPVPFPARPGISAMCPVTIGGVRWALEYDAGLETQILRNLQTNTGWILPCVGQEFHPDVRAIGSVLRWASSLTNGEGPADLVLYDVDPHTGATTKATVQGGALVWGPGPTLVPLGPPSDLPPLSAVPLLNRVFGFAVYGFNDAHGNGNIDLPIRPSGDFSFRPPSISTLEDEVRVIDGTLFALYAGESPTQTTEQTIDKARPIGAKRQRALSIYHDGYPMRASVLAKRIPQDLLGPQVYRNPNEPNDAYRERLRTAYRETSVHGETWVTINLHRRYNEHGPTLTVAETVWGFVLATQVAAEQNWPGMHGFREGLADCPEELLPYLQRFRSGIMGTPAARIISGGGGGGGGTPQGRPMRIFEYDETEPTSQPEIPGQGKVTVRTLQTILGERIPITQPVGSTGAGLNGGYGIKKPNGKFLTLTPGKVWEERDSILGRWEVFYDAIPGGMAAPDRDGQTFYIKTITHP